MARNWKKVAAIVLICIFALSAAMTMVACKDKNVPVDDPDLNTYRTYTSELPSNWNELTYEDNNDTQILNYLVSSFFEFDYAFENGKKFNDDGSINVDGIIPGGYVVKGSAATALDDVTSTVDAKWGYTDEQKAEGNYAWKITLRQDLKWDDGTPINAHDFVYTMQQQLDPAFRNMRASSYYTNMSIKGARDRVFSGATTYIDNVVSTDPIEFEYAMADLEKGEDGVYKMKGETPKPIKIALNSKLSWTNGNTLSQYVGAFGSQYFNMEHWEDLTAKADEDGRVDITDETIAWLTSLISTPDWNENADNVPCYFEYEGTYPEFPYENVGYYAASDYELVICLNAPIKAKKDDGSLSYEAAYSFSSMPLVKRDLYESCKIAPAEGATLWTTNYNSSLATSASWGPYKLTQFQDGKSYTLSRNENWYGYALEDNKNQYLVDKIFCEEISDVNTTWIKFLGGEIDDIGLDVNHKNDYRDSKYTYYAPGTGTFGLNIFADLSVLKDSERNNGILAIDEFREAISLYLDRDEYNSTCFTSHRACYGLLGPSYYYDVDNAGVYRDTQIAKEALLRVYGFTDNGNGTWSAGGNTYPDYQAAYDAMDGMNRILAKQLVEKVYTELTTNAATYGYDASKNITILMGASTDNENVRRHYDFFKKTITELVEGTSLEGKIDVTFSGEFGEDWAKAFKNGSYDLAPATGFSGGAFDPEGFLQCYVDPESGLMYSTWWDTNAEMMTYTMPAGDYEGAGEEMEMSILNWYCCLNGICEDYAEEYKLTKIYNWGAGFIPEEARMQLLAKIEELTLKKYFTIVTTSEYGATVYSGKFAQLTKDYNMFMSFGGMRYIRPVYNNQDWANFVRDNNNDMSGEYKKSE